MTKAQAAELRTIWEQRGDPQPCDHPNQELENSEDGYLTGAYHCLTCGEEFDGPSSLELPAEGLT